MKTEVLHPPSARHSTGNEFQRLCADAEHGHADAQYKLALAYFRGTGIPMSTAKSLFWLKKAAQPGTDTRTQEKAKNILQLFAILSHKKSGKTSRNSLTKKVVSKFSHTANQ